MRNRELIKEVESWLDEVQINLKGATQVDNEASIHKLRVAVKKLRTLNALLQADELQDVSLFLVRFLDFIRPLYKASGKVRDLQVLQKIMVAFELSYAGFESWLDGKMQKAQEGLKQVLDSYSSHSEASFTFLSSDLIPRLDTFQLDEDGNRFMKINSSEALALLICNEPGREWHEARRLLKMNYLFVAFVLDKKSCAMQNALHSYRTVEQLLGGWHDLHTLQKKINKYEASDKHHESQINRDVESLIRQKEAEIKAAYRRFDSLPH